MRLGDSRMKRAFDNWPKLAFLFIPLLIIVVDAAVIVDERTDSDSEKAIRLVRESRSRKENFTVQQYLYMTVYYRRDEGEQISIQGWSAEPKSELGKSFTVSFTFANQDTERVALWNVDLESRRMSPMNDYAKSISWR